MGGALFVWHQLLNKPRDIRHRDAQKGSLLGPSFSTESIRKFLTEKTTPYDYFDSEEKLLQDIAGEVPTPTQTLVRLVPSPTSIAPGTAMPALGLSDQQARDVAALLYTLR